MAKEQRLEQHIETIARWIIKCRRIVAFTGAGISPDSGIPDFRGPDGVWTQRGAVCRVRVERLVGRQP